MAGFFRGLSGPLQGNGKISPNFELNKGILGCIRKFHISVGVAFTGPRIAAASNDFAGLCVFHPDGEKIIHDAKGRRLESGYVAVQETSALKTPVGSNTYQRQIYNHIFGDVERQEDVVIIAFYQKEKALAGVSGIFETDNTTSFFTGVEPEEVICTFKCLTFGAILMTKLNGARDITPHAACSALCLFLIVKNHGEPEDLEKFPVTDISLEEGEGSVLEELLVSFMAYDIVEFAFRGKGKSEREIYRHGAYALKQLIEAMKGESTPAQFDAIMKALIGLYDRPQGSFLGQLVYDMALDYNYEFMYFTKEKSKVLGRFAALTI